MFKVGHKAEGTGASARQEGAAWKRFDAGPRRAKEMDDLRKVPVLHQVSRWPRPWERIVAEETGRMEA